MHFVKSTYNVDDWVNVCYLLDVRGDSSDSDWETAEEIAFDSLEPEKRPEKQAVFAQLPSTVSSSRGFKKFGTALKSHLYQTRTLTIYRCNDPKEYSEVGETEAEFRIRLTDAVRKNRDLMIEKMRTKYTAKLASLTDQIRNAEQRIDKEKSQYRSAQFSTAISFGTSLLSALFGRKLASTTNVTRAGTAMRGVGRTMEQRQDIAEAEQDAKALRDEFADLEKEFSTEVDKIETGYTVDRIELEALEVKPRKSDIGIENLAILWTPWVVDGTGIAEPAFACEHV